MEKNKCDERYFWELGLCRGSAPEIVFNPRAGIYEVINTGASEHVQSQFSLPLHIHI